jgi:Tol biopolymer transport system component
VGIGNENASTINNFTLYQNYPNPFNPATTIAFDLEKSGQVRLSVFDVSGKSVATILEGFTNAGHHEVVWNAIQFPSGVYFYQLESGNMRQVKKMFLLK